MIDRWATYLSLHETIGIHGWQNVNVGRVEQPEHPFIDFVLLNQIRNGLQEKLPANNFITVDVANL